MWAEFLNDWKRTEEPRQIDNSAVSVENDENSENDIQDL